MHIYVYTWVIALLQYFFECVSIHTQQYRTLSSLPNPGRSKYSMYRRMYVCMYVCPKRSNIYTLYQTLVGLYVYLSTYKGINLYPLYRTIVGLSMYFSTHKAIELYTHYRAMESLSVYYQGLYSSNYI